MGKSLGLLKVLGSHRFLDSPLCYCGPARAQREERGGVSMASTARKQQHAVAIPLPAQGHMNSLMRLCKKLASEGFTITFVNIDPIHHRIEEVSQEEEEMRKLGQAQAQALDIRRAHVPIEGLDLSNDYRFSFIYFFEAMKSLAPHLEQLLRNLTTTASPPVTCLISDFLLTGPCHQLPHKFNLPWIVFYPFSPSTLLYMDYVLHGDISQHEVVDAINKGGKGLFRAGLPGLPTINIQDLLSFKHLEDNNEYMYELTRREMQESIKGGHSMVVNSLEEAEEGALKALAERMKVPVYAVGPLVEELQEAVESATSLWKEDRGCMKWLDEQEPRSVIYISFGSITVLSRLQFEELVAGLLASKQPFLFVFRPDLVGESSRAFDPLQVLRNNAGRLGYVAEWTPQMRVLSHPSLGGFLTHCGLNSVMEALVHGVPMLCWPYFLDQFMNAKLVVEEWQVGLRFSSSSSSSSSSTASASLVTRHQVADTIHALLQGEPGKAIRNNALRLKAACSQSLSPGGTSCKSLQDLIHSLAL